MRYQHAIRGIEALSQNVDSMLIINNETLREKYGNLKLQKLSQKPTIFLPQRLKVLPKL